MPPPNKKPLVPESTVKSQYESAYLRIRDNEIVVWSGNLAVKFIGAVRENPNIAGALLDVCKQEHFEIVHDHINILENDASKKRRVYAPQIRYNKSRDFGAHALRVLYKLSPVIAIVKLKENPQDNGLDEEDHHLLENDPLLQQQVVDAFNNRWKSILIELVNQINTMVGTYSAQQGVDTGQLLKNFDVAVKKEVEAAIDRFNAGQCITEVFENYHKTKKGYKKYKRKMAGKVVLGGLATAGSAVGTVVSVATTPLTGGLSIAGLVFSIYGLVRSALALVKTICDLAADADALESRVYSGIWSYSQTPQTANDIRQGNLPPTKLSRISKQRTAGEIASTTFTSFVGEVVQMPASAAFMSKSTATRVTANRVYHKVATNLKQISEDCELWYNKLMGLEVKSHTLAVQLNKLLNKLTTLENGFKSKGGNANQLLFELDKSIIAKINQNQTTTGVRKSLREILAEAQQENQAKFRNFQLRESFKIREKIDTLLGAVVGLQEKIQRGKRQYDAAADWIEDAEGKMSIHLKRFEKAMPITANMATTAASFGIGVGSLAGELVEKGAKLAENAQELGVHIYGWVSAVYDLGMSVGSEVHDAKMNIVY